ncbi:hypothetical protein SCUCBS95973_004110 [Sporothrix curviconia]|uniref:Uncharacterized protein n=1 Tax=Sporothrix curviconia TaxID=1260050 RepID=A0ABP0BL09_9PEZI
MSLTPQTLDREREAIEFIMQNLSLARNASRDVLNTVYNELFVELAAEAVAMHIKKFIDQTSYFQANTPSGTMELCLMVWDAAALPPACLHYIVDHAGGEHTVKALCSANTLPVQPALPDCGLWLECRESRKCVRRVYHTVIAYTCQKGFLPDSDPMEMYYRNLAAFNNQILQVQDAIRLVTTWYGRQVNYVEQLPKKACVFLQDLFS